MNWLRKILPKIQSTDTKKVPEGVWHKCDACNAMLYRVELEKNLFVCPKCSHHLRFGARARIASFLDADNQEEIGTQVVAKDRLRFRDSKKYKDRISTAVKNTGEEEALITIKGDLHGIAVVVCCFNFDFIGGSMSTGVGERFIQGVNVAINEKIPFICFSTSGGARMQEGLFSLMQMAKTSAGLARFSEYNLPYISVLLDPTMGGVSASLATLGDIIIAEPKALIGFSGPRVIEQTIRQSLPEGFQRSEFLLEHGAIDMICDRRQLRDRVANIIAKLQGKDEIDIAPIAKKTSVVNEEDEPAK